MSAILNSLNANNFLTFQPILMTRVSKFMVYRALSDQSRTNGPINAHLTIAQV